MNWFLRTGFCTIWMAALILMISNMAAGIGGDDVAAKHALICGGVFLAGALAHSYLIGEANKKEEKNDKIDD